MTLGSDASLSFTSLLTGRICMRVAAPLVTFLSRRAAASSALALLIGLGACDALKPKEACSVTVAPLSLSLPVNSSAQIVGTAFDCSGNSIRDKRIAYNSGNPAIAQVTDVGVVIAVAVGTTNVSAVADGKSASIPVTVTAEQIANITVSPNAVTLRPGNARQFTALARTASGAQITDRSFLWQSSNASVASVDQNGNVTAIGVGSTVISAEADRVAGTATVTVQQIPIASCRLTPGSSKITVSQQVQPSITLLDSAQGIIPPTGRPVVWSSNNEVVASVSQSGLVVGLRAGTAEIRVSPTENPAVQCVASVEVVPARIARVVINPKVGSLRIGIPRTLSYSLMDSVGGVIPGGRTVTWSTPTPAELQVNQAGLVTGLALGTGRVIVSAEGVADTATFTVTKIPIASIVVSPLQTTVTEGQTAQLRATVVDSAGTEVTDRPLDWTTSDPTRATVSPTGLVTAVAPGAVVVQAVSATENRAGQATVIVQQIPVDNIVAVETFTVNLGQSNLFAMQLRDAQGRTLLNRNVLVTSDFPGIAVGQASTTSTSVSVSGLAEGTARLTLQAIDANSRPQGTPRVVVVTVQRPPATPPIRQDTR